MAHSTTKDTHKGNPVTPQQMATTWLDTWLAGVGVHGLRPAPGEPLLRWLLHLHHRAATEELLATEGLAEHQAATLDELRHEIVATQRDTLPPEAQVAVRSSNILAVRAAETAAIVWTLAALDAYTSPTDTITNWRQRLHHTADQAARCLDDPADLAASQEHAARAAPHP